MHIKTYTKETLAEGCSIALKNRLYVSGWSLSRGLCYARKSGKGTLALLFIGDKPVAVCFSDEYGSVETFVRKSQRRKGFGAAVLLAVKSVLKKKLKGQCGIKGSMEFYKSSSVRYIG